MQALVSEVGPRDGLQSIKRAMPTEAKHRWIRALAASGLKEIEVASFVPAKLLPQMADAGEVVREAVKIRGLTVLALAPNLRGAQNAILAGAHKVTLPVSASHMHSQSNIRKTVDEAIEVAVRLAKQGAESVGLSDTTGYANPAQVKRMFKRLRAELGDKAGGAHLHNTRGQGLANVVAALDAGVTTFDSSQGGMGGCPYAPGASGNIVTEDLVFLLESMRIDTGIDIDKLLASRKILMEGLPGEPIYGHLPDAGLPKGFKFARDAA